MRTVTCLLSLAFAALLLVNLGCGPDCEEGYEATESGECVPIGDDDDTTATDDDDDTTAGDDDDTVDDDDTTDDDDDTVDDDDDTTADDDDDTGPTDADGDGFDSTDDCDDNNADIYPGAPEVVGNAADDDCDGQTDEVNILYVANTMAPNAEVLPTELLAIGGDCMIFEPTLDATDATSLSAVDPTLYHVVLIDSWTAGGAGTWMGDASIVAGWNLPILGFGMGGSALLMDAGVNLDFGDVHAGITDSMVATETGHDFFNLPHAVLTGDTVAAASMTVMSHAPNAATGESIATHPDAPDYSMLIHDTAYPDWWLLGLGADGTQLSTEGFQLTMNILLNLAGRQDCTP
jgi:hypothetical protein